MLWKKLGIYNHLLCGNKMLPIAITGDSNARLHTNPVAAMNM